MKRSRAQSTSPANTRQLSALLIPTLIIIITLALAAGLLIHTVERTEQQHSEQRLQEASAAYLGHIEQIIHFIEADSAAVARNPALITAMQDNDSQALSRLQQQLNNRAYVDDTVLSTLGAHATRHAKDVLNFAALDHIGQAETNKPTDVEYVTTQDNTYFYKATPIVNGLNHVIGTVMLVYDAPALLQPLSQSLNTASMGLKLVQQLPSAPAVSLLQGSQPVPQPRQFKVQTAHPFWTLELQQTTPTLLNNPKLAYYAGVLLLSLLGALLAMLALRSTSKLPYIRDIATLRNALQSKQLQLLDDSSLQTVEVQRLAQEVKRDQAKSSQAAAPQTPAKPLVAEPAPETSTRPKRAPNNGILTPENALEIDILDLDFVDELDLSGSITAGNAQDVKREIFRAYDVRGIVDTTLDDNTAYWLGRAVGSESLAQGVGTVAIARDGRLSGPSLATALAQGLVEAGCDVIDLGMVPTPALYFATHQLDTTSGVMVTGSHNPADYNGFKIVIAGETLANERIDSLYQRIIQQDLSSGGGSVAAYDILPDYLEYISNDVAMGRPMKIVMDCGNGVASVIAPQLFEALGCTVVPLFCEVDGTFPNHHPDPGQPENLHDLIQAVQHEQADIGIAFDGDGDRLGIVTNTGEIIHPDRLMMLLAKDVVSRNPGADILFDVKCTRRLATLISRYGGRPIMWKTGHSLMKAKLKETQALLAGEMSGHIFFQERWFGFDDGIYSAARVLEILSMVPASSAEIFAEFPVSPTTPELSIEVTEDSKFAIIEALQDTADWGDGSLNTLDGIRVDFHTGWGLIRASNTTPKLVLRFEGDTQAELERIQVLFRDQLFAVAPDIHWPF